MYTVAGEEYFPMKGCREDQCHANLKNEAGTVKALHNAKELELYSVENNTYLQGCFVLV